MRPKSAFALRTTLLLGLIAVAGQALGLPAAGLLSASSSSTVEPSTEPQLEPAHFLPLVFGALRTGVLEGSIQHGELLREYILYVPDSYTGQQFVPLIVNYHAYTRDALAQMNYGDFRAVAERTGAIIAHPQGAELNGIRRWNVGGLYTHPLADDVGFTAALIDKIADEYDIDPTRIYSTGFSNGAYMSYLTACQLSDRIAAVAPVAGSMTPETLQECAPGRPLPVLHIHGLDDAVVPYAGDANSIAVDDALGYWIAHNGNAHVAVVTQRPDIDPADSSTVEHLVFGDGGSGVTTELLRVIAHLAWRGYCTPRHQLRYRRLRGDLELLCQV